MRLRNGLPLQPGGSWLSDAGVRELPPKGDSKEPINTYEVILGEGIAREMGADRPEAMSKP